MTEDTTRASDADIEINCGKAHQPPEMPIETSGPEAALGSAVHASLEHWLPERTKAEPEPQPFANEHGVDVDKVAELIAKAPNALKEIREDLSSLQPEVRVQGGLIRGRIDGLSLRLAGSRLFSCAILDWKTGQDPQNSKPNQRLAYASAVEAMYGMPAQKYIYTAEIWLATGVILEARYDKTMIEGFRTRLAYRRKRGIASPGVHCKYCRRKHECLEWQTYIRSSALELAELAPDLTTPDALALLWDKSRALKSALERYEKAVDAMLDEHGGLDLPNDRRLCHVKQTRDIIDVRKAWPVMRAAGLDNDAINKALTLNKTKLLEQIALPAARGQKQKAREGIMVALDEAGAIARKVIRRRTII
jgi:hypothetical protein